MEKSDPEKRGGRLENAILIAGPTASGKSAAAIAVAQAVGGAVINTDSMQGYSILNVLTARPTAADLRRAPHHLYGHVHPSTPYSTGAWLRDVMRLIETGAVEGQVPIFVGGTGLYFRALLQGMSEIPPIPEQVRNRWRYELMEQGPHKLYRLLMREDPQMALMLQAADGQRIVRALEVLESTGRSLRDWQAVAGLPLVDQNTARLFVIEGDRADLARRIETRFDQMVSLGAADEVRALMDLHLDPALPAMKAIGVRELAAAASGNISQADAIIRAKVATRQYAKRQSTWYRTQFGSQWHRVPSAGALLSYL